MKTRVIFFVSSFLIITACSDTDKPKEIVKSSSVDKPIQQIQIQPRPAPNPNRNAYFGDLHVHTANSFDAYTFGTISSPSDAYRYAQGEAIRHPTGYQIQLRGALDFYSVTDHGVFLGLLSEAAHTNSEFSK